MGHCQGGAAACVSGELGQSVGALTPPMPERYLRGEGAASCDLLTTPSAAKDPSTFEATQPFADVSEDVEADESAHKTKQICKQDPRMMQFYEKYLTSKKLADCAVSSKRKLEELDNLGVGDPQNYKRSKRLGTTRSFGLAEQIDLAQEYSEFMKIEKEEEGKHEDQEQDISHVPVMPMVADLEGDIYDLDEGPADAQLLLIQDKTAAQRIEKVFKKKLRPLTKNMNSK